MADSTPKQNNLAGNLDNIEAQQLAFLDETLRLLQPETDPKKQVQQVESLLEKMHELQGIDLEDLSPEVRNRIDEILYQFIPFFTKILTSAQIMQFMADENGRGQQIVDQVIELTKSGTQHGAAVLFRLRISDAEREFSEAETTE